MENEFINKYKWEDFNNLKLFQLKNIYGLNDLVAQGKDEFEKQLLLKKWVHTTLPNGTPKDYSQLSALEMLEDAKNDFKFWCTEYAFTFLQCATALGWYSRKLGIDYEHSAEQKDRHHGIADIWSSTFQKWYVIDAQHNLHYEKEGIPLNAFEIRSEYLRNKAQDVKGISGNHVDTLTYSPTNEGFDTPSNYFWFFASQRNNFFEEPGLFNTKTYLWVDEYNENKIWYKFKNGVSEPHPMYANQFIKTSDLNLIFPKIQNS